MNQSMATESSSLAIGVPALAAALAASALLGGCIGRQSAAAGAVEPRDSRAAAEPGQLLAKPAEAQLIAEAGFDHGVGGSGKRGPDTAHPDLLSICWHPLSCAVETRARVRGGCRKITAPGAGQAPTKWRRAGCGKPRRCWALSLPFLDLSLSCTAFPQPATACRRC